MGVGDFDNDGYDDLAIGARGEEVNSNQNAGAVQVLYGSSQGLTDIDDQFWNQATPGILNSPSGWDNFGSALAVGDFDNDGYDDLAVGVPGENINLVGDAGAVNVIYGSSSGLDAAGDQFWHQARAGILDGINADDQFGSSLAAGDFNDDGYDDLAIGVPKEDVNFLPDAGAVNVIYGSSIGLDAAGDQFWHQDFPGIVGGVEAGDSFGLDLSAGDLNGDGFDDLAIGVRKEAVGTVQEAGAVQVIHGGAAGLAASGNQLWHQNSPGLYGACEAHDFFGHALAIGEFDGLGSGDLAVGVWGESIGDLDDAGLVQILLSSGLFADGFETGDTSAWSSEIR